jgi:hypothetical protein
VWRERAARALFVFYTLGSGEIASERLREESAAVPRSTPSRVVSKSVLGRHGNHRVVDVMTIRAVRAADAAAAVAAPCDAPWRKFDVERARARPISGERRRLMPNFGSRARLFRKGNAPLSAF